MIYSQCNPKKHNLVQVAELIYSTEPDLSKMIFGKNKNKAIKRLVKLINNKSNSFSYKNINLAIESGKVLGIVNGYCGKDYKRDEEIKDITDTLDFFGALRLSFYEKLLISRILTTKIKDEDYYINVISVDKNSQRKGIGNNLIKISKEKAIKKNCSRIILDVSKDNKNGINFYKKIGFKIYDEVTYRFLLIKISVYKMELSLLF